MRQCADRHSLLAYANDMNTFEELRTIYDFPWMELVLRAASVHRQHHDPKDIQRCVLLSIKTGGCPEDRCYCSQSPHYQTPVEATPFLDAAEVVAKARQAREMGATRFCLGAAWRGVKDGPAFDQVLEMVRAVRSLGLEACVTLGMLTDEQAQRLAEAGLTAHNHNLDTARSFYGNVVRTRTNDDRLRTIASVQKARIAVCCGGILGMGESVEDRLNLLAELSALEPPPESIPINCLVPIPGTPLGDAAPVDPLELVRMIATTRIAFPKARVRLSAGRDHMSRELRALCFLAGANSIFYGDRLLTAANPSKSDDTELFRSLGLPLVGETIP
jgi:biotin synthase